MRKVVEKNEKKKKKKKKVTYRATLPELKMRKSLEKGLQTG